MKIRAIRVAECGRFGPPAALEGLSGGLDLLIEPNEAGKSTLVRALKAVLFQRHTTRSREIEALRPYRGGAPLVEVDIEVGDAVWRVRKRFLAERLAEVRSLSDGSITRGADAEARLEQLLAAGAGLWQSRLLWLGQGTTLADPAPDADAEAALRSAVEGEVHSTIGGGALRQVRGAVESRLGEMVSLQREQPRGRYLAATRTLAAAAAAATQVREQYDRAEAMLVELSALTPKLEGLADPALRLDEDRALAEAEARVVEVRASLGAREAARSRLAVSRAEFARLDGETKGLEEGTFELARLIGEAERSAANLRELDGALSASAAAAQSADAARVTAAADLALAIAHRTALVRARERAELEARVDKARSADGRIAALDRDLQGIAADPESVPEARRLAARAAQLSSALAAQSARVSIAYEPGAVGRVTLEGKPLADGEVVTATGPIELSIAGVGRVMLSPGQSAERDRNTTDLDEARSRLAAVLGRAGVATLEELESTVWTLRDLRSARAEALSELRALAPDGLAALEQRMAALAPLPGALPLAGEHPGIDWPALDRAIVALELVETRAAGELSRARDSETALRQKRAASSATTDALARRLAELAARLPPEAERDQVISATRAARDTAKLAHDEALLAVSAAAAKPLDASDLASVEARVATLRAKRQRADAEIARLRAEHARLEGALSAVQSDDLVARLARSEAEVSHARESVADFSDEVEALRLLIREIDAQEAAIDDRYLAPVLSRLRPLIELALPGADIALRRGFGVAELNRPSGTEPLERLSDGTREQIAVVVRLAFARLLADQGAAVPVILDDALVYADDTRIARMHRVLEAAAEGHQVIVLSGREDAFRGLRGHRVTLRPWQPHGAA